MAQAIKRTKPTRRKQQQNLRPDLFLGNDVGDDQGSPSLVLFGVLLLQAPGDGVHFRAGLLDRYAGLEEAVDDNRARVAVQLGGREGKGHPDLDILAQDRIKPEIRRQDADDRERLGIYRDGPADDRGVGGKASPPKTVSQDYDAVAAGLLLFGTKIAAQRGLNPEQREKTGRDAHAVKLFRIAWSGQCVEPEARRGEPFKGCVVLAPMEKIQRRYRYSRPALARVGCPNLDQPVPIRERQGSEQHAVDHAEHRGVGADPHRQGQSR